MSVIVFTISQTAEDINYKGRLSPVQRLLDSNKAMKLWNSELPADAMTKFPTSRIIRSIVGLMTAGDCRHAAARAQGLDNLRDAAAGKEQYLCQVTVPDAVLFGHQADYLVASPGAVRRIDGDDFKFLAPADHAILYRDTEKNGRLLLILPEPMVNPSECGFPWRFLG